MPYPSHKISIIIPVLNEASYIGKLLEHIAENSSKENIEEIIVVDGGSTDESQNIIGAYKKIVLLQGSKGRAKQMNLGAQNAKGSILYFLHADSFPPKDFDLDILKEVQQNNIGCYRLRFENPDHQLLRVSQWFTRFNFSLFRGGDQSLFIRKEDFETLNGFNEQFLIYEDIEFINRIYLRFNFVVINRDIITSERKFRKNGIVKLHFNFLMIHIKSWLGASPEALYNYYNRQIRE